MSKRVSFLGILLGINQIFLFFSSIIPTNRLFFLGISSLPISLVIIENGFKSGLLFYTASALLSIVLIPNKIYLIPYILFFGIYGLIKYLIEKNRNLIIEYSLKFLSFNIIFFIGYSIIKNFIFVKINIIIILISQVFFLAYDYAYGLFINYYYEKIKGKMGL
ncbi:hypothetical protein [Tepidibacter formicigenes]|jgi:hypothetical protein|uniref:Rod shape-determining protein MreD n=1 Tax=Tepidibacter formicigenes DSM 15518 TaxID=1123349 RepID=A0A1M6NEC6_9FIRM|nr:hypothetical protein [Tepidibacter formicigenes]SHJ94098.1 hypothetical protein SAMN02744037_01245 [Tepidibacter formicigenes DSM 15518]